MAEHASRALWTRLISGVALAAVALAAVAGGTPWLELMVVTVGLLMSREWAELCLAGAGRLALWRPRPSVPGVALVLITAAALGVLASGRHAEAIAIAVGGGALTAVLAPRLAVLDRLILAAGLPYVVVPAAAILWIGADADHGVLSLLWLLLTVWATDSGGYAGGKLIGGPRLVPAVSPNKTWAGFAAGIALAVIAGAVLAAAAGAGIGRVAAASAAVGLVAQGGDLLESLVKRHFEVKDSGTIIPGHGGLFDRLDGLLAAAPVVAVAFLMAGGASVLWR
ncbi:MAG TPA: phosphatidate cytidylyltransferase [Alphaproteobacteria bacterium]